MEQIIKDGEISLSAWSWADSTQVKVREVRSIPKRYQRGIISNYNEANLPCGGFNYVRVSIYEYGINRFGYEVSMIDLKDNCITDMYRYSSSRKCNYAHVAEQLINIYKHKWL